MQHPGLEAHRDLIEGLLRLVPEEGPSRVCTLRQAIERHVRPGMRLHTLVTHAFPHALVGEVARRFWRRDPGFELVTLGAVNHAVILLHGGLLRRIVTSYCGDIYPAPGPNPNFNRAYLSGRVAIENWSVLSLTLRLLAAALGVEGLPCRTLRGSTMAEDNRAAYAEIELPFGGGREGFVRALRPDLSLLHGWVADPAGNVVVSPPLSEDLWGALAARDGVVASVEKIVDADFVRAHAHLVRLPASRVRAVVELPFGAHPGGLFGRPVATCSSYAEDYDFIVAFREANRDPEAFDRWIEQWVLGCADHRAYLERVGPSRLTDLIQKGRPDAWQDELARLAEGIPENDVPTPAERMTVEAARRLRDRCRRGGHRAILAGQGASNLAAWLAYYLLQREGRDVELVAETGFYGYDPRPGNPFLFNFANIPRCKMLGDALVTLGALVGGPGAGCIGSLSAGQVDRRGNLNSTMVPGVFYIVGSGGACDVLNTAEEVVVTLPMAQARFVEQVTYVTGPGGRVTAVVSDRAVFEKEPGGESLRLVAIMPDGDKTREEAVRDVRGRVGWELDIPAEPVWVEPPTAEELRAVRLFDPRRAFLDG